MFPRVLIVDDCITTCRRLAKELHAHGYVARTANDGVQALQMMHEDCPDYVITDWQMPNMNGEMLCRCIRSHQFGKYVFLIMMTAHANMLDLVDGLAAGADDYVTKPVDMRELLARMASGSRILGLDRRLTHVAQHDPLTGILNRRNLMASISEEVEICKHRHRPVACIMLDLDHFKSINDRFGHLAGDSVLMQVATVLRRHFRQSDFICRYGGEEFAVILPNCEEVGAEHCAERCRFDIEEQINVEDIEEAVGTDVNSFSVTTSFGVAESTHGELSPTILIEHADFALRQAKANGRNRVVRYSTIDPELLGTVEAEENDATTAATSLRH